MGGGQETQHSNCNYYYKKGHGRQDRGGTDKEVKREGEAAGISAFSVCFLHGVFPNELTELTWWVVSLNEG